MRFKVAPVLKVTFWDIKLQLWDIRSHCVLEMKMKSYRPIMTSDMVAFQLHSPGTVAISNTMYSWHPLLKEVFHMNEYFSCFIQPSRAVARASLCITTISMRKRKQSQNLSINQKWRGYKQTIFWLFVKAKHFHTGYNHKI